MSASPYVVAVELQIQGNAATFAANFKRQFGGLNIPVNLDSSGAVAGAARLTSGIGATRAAFQASQSQAAAFNATLNTTVNVGGQVSNQLANIGAQAGLAARRFAGMAVAAGSIVQLSNSLRQGVGAAIEFSTAMNKISQISGNVNGEVARVREQIGSLATSLGVSSKELADVSGTLQRAGLRGREFGEALEAVALADLSPNFASMKSAADTLIVSMRQFGITTAQAKDALGGFAALGGEFSTSGEDIADAIKAVGGTFKSLAGDVQTPIQALTDFGAIVASVKSKTQESAAGIGAGLRAIFSRLENSANVEALKDLGVQMRYTRQEAEQFGDTKLDNKFVGAFEAVKRLSGALAGLSTTDTRFASIAQSLGGYREIEKILPLLKDAGVLERAKNAETAAGVKLLSDAEIRQESLSNKTAKLKEEYLQLFRGLVDSKGFQSIGDALLKVASGFETVLKFAGPLLPALTALAAIKIAVNLPQIGGAASSAFTSAARSRAYARGGPVGGVGDTDSEHALLMPGEFVIRKQSAKKIGYDRLNNWNEGRFADGGNVPALLAYRRDPRLTKDKRDDARLLKLSPGYQSAATRYISGRIGLAENDGPPPLDGQQRATLEGVFYERFLSRHWSNHNPGEGLDFPSLSKQDKSSLSRLTGTPVDELANISGVEAKRTASSRNLRETIRKSQVGFSGGGSSTDTIHALLTPGEFVLNRDAAAHLGAAELQHMNKHGKTQRFANGGFVRMEGGGPTEPDTYSFKGLSKNYPEFAGAASAQFLATFKDAILATTKVLVGLDTAGNAVIKSFTDERYGTRKIATLRPVTDLVAEAATEKATRPGGLPEEKDNKTANPLATVAGLTPTQLAFYNQHSAAAKYQATKRGSQGGDELEDAANNALAAAAVKSTDDPKIGIGYVKTAAQRAVIQKLAELKKKTGEPAYDASLNVAPAPIEEVSYARKLRDQVRGATLSLDASKEQGTNLGTSVIPGSLVSSSQEPSDYGLLSKTENDKNIAEHRQLQLKAKELKISGGGTTDALRERIADKLRGPKVPSVTASNSFPPSPPRPPSRVSSSASGGERPKQERSYGPNVASTGAGPNDPNFFGPPSLLLKDPKAYAYSENVLAATRAIADERANVSLKDTDRGTSASSIDSLISSRASGTFGAGVNPIETERLERLQRLRDKKATDARNRSYRDAVAGGDVQRRSQNVAGSQALLSAATYSGAGDEQRALQLRILREDIQRRENNRQDSAAFHFNYFDQLGSSRTLKGSAEHQVYAASIPGQPGPETASRAAELATLRADIESRLTPGVFGRVGGFFSGAADKTRGLLGGARSGIGNALTSAANSRFGQSLDKLRPAALPLLFGLPLASSLIDGTGGTAEAAAASGGGRYSAAKGASGLLSGAVLGGTIGASLGGPAAPIIGAAGAVAGGLIGLVNSLHEAEKDIRQVKINNALTIFSDRLNQFAQYGDATNPATIQEAKENLWTYQSESNEKNRKEATGYLGGFDGGAFSALQSRSDRQEFGPQLANISGVLQKQADKLGRTNLASPLDNLAKDLENGNNGLNREFLAIVARVRGLSVPQVLYELKKNIQGGQREGVRDKEALAGRTGEERNVNSFGRLLLAVQSSADSLGLLQAKAQALADVFDGTVNSTKVSGHAEALSQLGRNDRGALLPLDTIAAIGGDDGARLRGAGGVADDLSRVLPGVLASVAGRNQLKEGDIASEVRKGVLDELSPSAKPSDQLANGLNVVIHNLNEATRSRGVSGLTNEVRVDTTKFVDKLIAQFSDPLKEIGGKISKELEEQANKFVDGLTHVAKITQVIGQSVDARANLGVQRYRVETTFQAADEGRRHQTEDLLELPRLEAGQRARQERLVRQPGPLAESPEFIGERLAAVRSKIDDAVGRQQDVYNRTGGKGEEFVEAAKNLTRLKDQASDLVQALKNLTDAAGRTAESQKKLESLQQEKDSRLSLAERYATGSSEDILRLNQGALLANAANNKPGSIDQYSQDERKLIFEFLNSAKGITLTGFKGGPKADDVRDNLLGQLGGGSFKLDKSQQAEEKELRKTIAERFAVAEKAYTELIGFEKTTRAAFFSDMLKMQEQFFTRLGGELKTNSIKEADNKVGSTRVALGDELKQQDKASLLASVGITTNAQYAALQSASGDVTGLATAYGNQRKLQGGYTQASGAVKKAFDENELDYNKSGTGAIDAAGLEKIKTLLVERGGLTGGTGGSADKVAQRFAKSSKEGYDEDQFEARRLIESGVGRDDARRRLVSRRLQGALSDELLSGREGTESGESLKKIREAQGKLRGINGLNVDALGGKLDDGEGQANFLESLKAFNGTDKTLEGLAARLNKVKEAAEQAAAALAQLKTGGLQGVAPVVETGGFAQGGSVFRPRGSDTVPAMLTPGEFVVNRSDAQANISLLKHINGGGSVGLYRGGLVYAAEGGLAPDRDPDADTPILDPRDEIANRERQRVPNGPFPPATGFGPPENKVASPLPTTIVFQTNEEREQKERETAKQDKDWKSFAKNTEDDLQFQAAANPFGGSALLLGKRAAIAAAQKRNAASRDQDRATDALLAANNPLVIAARSREEARQRAEAQAGGRAVGLINLAGNISNFNRRTSLSGQRSRPGDEGQKRIADTGFANAQSFNNLQAQKDFDFKRWQEEQTKAQNIAAALRKAKDPHHFADGGPVPGTGTGDTVPALLSPGEFVMNRGATSRMGPHNLQRFNQGGIVRGANYLANGGVVGDSAGGGTMNLGSEALQAMSQLTSAFGSFAQYSQGLAQTMTIFSGNATALADALKNMPKSLAIQGQHNVVVTMNGAEVMSRLTPEIQQMVTVKVKEALASVFRDQLPDAGIQN